MRPVSGRLATIGILSREEILASNAKEERSWENEACKVRSRGKSDTEPFVPLCDVELWRLWRIRLLGFVRVNRAWKLCGRMFLWAYVTLTKMILIEYIFVQPDMIQPPRIPPQSFVRGDSKQLYHPRK